jgi:hypothetical protein
VKRIDRDRCASLRRHILQNRVERSIARSDAGGSDASHIRTIRRRRIFWSASTAANSLPTATWSATPATTEPVIVRCVFGAWCGGRSARTAGADSGLAMSKWTIFHFDA